MKGCFSVLCNKIIDFVKNFLAFFNITKEENSSATKFGNKNHHNQENSNSSSYTEDQVDSTIDDRSKPKAISIIPSTEDCPSYYLGRELIQQDNSKHCTDNNFVRDNNVSYL